MDKTADLIKQTSQTKHSTRNTRTCAHSEEVFDYVWRGLQAARLLTKDMVINGVDYRYWRDNLRDLSDNYLRAGLKHSGTFIGYMGWGEFRKLCMDGYSIQKAQNFQSAEPTTARISDFSTMGNKRFQELCQVTREMNAEPIDGPIHRATSDGKLSKSFVRGKSAEEIIDFCKNLYR